MLEKLRKELHEYIELYGRGDIRTIKKSEELDLEVNKEMYRKIGALKRCLQIGV